MRGFSKTMGYLLSGVFLLSWVFVPGKSWAQVSDKFLKEAKTLAKLEDDFFKKRLNNDLKGAYNYQHPDYKEKISIEEYRDLSNVVAFPAFPALSVSFPQIAGICRRCRNKM